MRWLCCLCLLLSWQVLAETESSAETSEKAVDVVATDCICLLDLATDNVIRNCKKQQRGNDAEPRFFCIDDDGIRRQQENIDGWEVLAADDDRCMPCEQTSHQPNSDGTIRGD